LKHSVSGLLDSFGPTFHLREQVVAPFEGAELLLRLEQHLFVSNHFKGYCPGQAIHFLIRWKVLKAHVAEARFSRTLYGIRLEIATATRSSILILIRLVVIIIVGLVLQSLVLLLAAGTQRTGGSQGGSAYFFGKSLNSISTLLDARLAVYQAFCILFHRTLELVDTICRTGCSPND